MKFWDSSAIVSLLVGEKTTARLASVQDVDPAIVTWWGSAIECASALARHERLRTVNQDQVTAGFQRLTVLQKDWEEIQPAEIVRELGVRLLRVHALQATDALQLAAAAEREGFNVIGS